MPTTHPSAVEAVHRLLFRALLEMRSQGRERHDKNRQPETGNGVAEP